MLKYMGMFNGLIKKGEPHIMLSVVLGGTRSQLLHRDPRDFAIIPLKSCVKLWIARNDLRKNERNKENTDGHIKFPHLR